MLSRLLERDRPADDAALWLRARSAIANGTMTLSKMPDRYVDGVYPKYVVRGDGCRLYDSAGKEYIDYICGLGTNFLGYRNEAVDNAVIRLIAETGNIFSLPHPDEVVLAERLRQVVQCCQKIKIFKTGSEAVSAAVKTARIVTGREKVLVCGYHGWHDWYTVSTDKAAGIPGQLKGLVAKFKYNDVPDLERLLKRGDVAAVIMEPVVYEEPRRGYLEAVSALAGKHGALLVFDEVVTGVRFGLGGAMRHYGVTPDLACYSKALGNGYPIAVLMGRDMAMAAFDRPDFFVSGTFGGDLVGIIAAMAVMDAIAADEAGTIGRIWKAGRDLAMGFNSIVLRLGLDGVYCRGTAPRTIFDFPSAEHKALFWQECVRRGVLFGHANFTCAAHDDEAISRTLDVCAAALTAAKRAWKRPTSSLDGPIPVEVFRLPR